MSKVQVHRVRVQRQRERGAEEISEEIMGKNSPKLTRDNKPGIQEGQGTQSQVSRNHRQHPVGSKFAPGLAQSGATGVL